MYTADNYYTYPFADSYSLDTKPYLTSDVSAN